MVHNRKSSDVEYYASPAMLSSSLASLLTKLCSLTAAVALLTVDRAPAQAIELFMGREICKASSPAGTNIPGKA